MGWTPYVETVDAADVEIPRVIKKQVWNGKEFVPVTMYRRNGVLNDAKKMWLVEQFGKRGPRWDYSLTGNFYVMDEQVYAWFQLKWGK